MTGSAKQSIGQQCGKVDCFVALLLAMTARAGRREIVIASEAKQSMVPQCGKVDCFVRFTPRNDGKGRKA
jgi:hypothetical protein